MEYTLLTFIAACCKFKSVSHHFGIKEVQPQPSFSALRGDACTRTCLSRLSPCDLGLHWSQHKGQQVEAPERVTAHEISTWMASFMHLMTARGAIFLSVHREWMAHVHDSTITEDSS